ncbi:MAG: alpha/beta hydrolase [Acidobacteriaceae bacterium]|jgi:pimeloyl-ACP methyl ester carboxylesterase
MPQLQTSDLSLHYQESGVGTPVILIHGHPFDCTSWSPQLIASFPGYRLIAPDLRNFGRTTSPNPPANFSTYARDLLAFADALALDEFFVAGLSMGGQVALEIAAAAPSRLLGLIFCDTFAQLDTPAKKSARLALADRLDAEGLAAYAVEVLPKMMCPKTIADHPEVAAELLRMMQRAPAAGASAALRTRAERRDYLPLLPKLNLPTLIVVGIHDQFTPVADAELMHQHIRNSTLIVLQDAGHITNLEQPAAFNRALATFLGSDLIDPSNR